MVMRISAPLVSLAPAAFAQSPSRRRRLPLRAKLFTAALIFGSVRFALVGNPWVWDAYAARLHPEDIGWRQVSVVSKRVESLDPPPPARRLLAVGSSQTEAVYRAYAERHPELAVFEMAAMGPFDFVTYSPLIRRQNPDTLLLFLSDFDMARPPDPDALVLSPAQGLRSLRIWGQVLSEESLDSRRALVAEMAVGELFPEFKYRFVFRGIVDKAMRRIAQRLAPSPADTEEHESITTRVRILRSEISQANLAFHERFLTEFLGETSSWGTAVLIVEGQYNPIVSDSSTVRVREEVRRRLVQFADAFPHVRYVSSSEVLVFSETDFQDLSHVTPEAGYAFVRALLDHLRRPPRSGTRPSAPDGLVPQAPQHAAHRPQVSSPPLPDHHPSHHVRSTKQKEPHLLEDAPVAAQEGEPVPGLVPRVALTVPRSVGVADHVVCHGPGDEERPVPRLLETKGEVQVLRAEWVESPVEPVQ